MWSFTPSSLFVSVTEYLDPLSFLRATQVTCKGWRSSAGLARTVEAALTEENKSDPCVVYQLAIPIGYSTLDEAKQAGAKLRQWLKRDCVRALVFTLPNGPTGFLVNPYPLVLADSLSTYRWPDQPGTYYRFTCTESLSCPSLRILDYSVLKEYTLPIDPPDWGMIFPDFFWDATLCHLKVPNLEILKGNVEFDRDSDPTGEDVDEFFVPTLRVFDGSGGVAHSHLDWGTMPASLPALTEVTLPFTSTYIHAAKNSSWLRLSTSGHLRLLSFSTSWKYFWERPAVISFLLPDPEDEQEEKKKVKEEEKNEYLYVERLDIQITIWDEIDPLSPPSIPLADLIPMARLYSDTMLIRPTEVHVCIPLPFQVVKDQCMGIFKSWFPMASTISISATLPLASRVLSSDSRSIDVPADILFEEEEGDEEGDEQEE